MRLGSTRSQQRESLTWASGNHRQGQVSDLRIRLLAPDGTDEQYIEWEAEVGFFDEWRPTFAMILGQRGFFDQFTVTMSLFSLQTAVEPLEQFDSRFGVPLAPSHPQSLRSRFR